MNLEEVRKNLHQQHWEDLVLFGREGLEELNDKIEGFKKQLSNDEGYNITQKIDGAPAVLVGHGLEGYPDVCVGIKSFLTDPKNALSSIEEIEAKYNDRPGMATMLKYSLQLAKEIPSGEAWQGDCLFVKSTLKTREINGVNYITFQPNKIIYAFPEDSESYDKIINSDFGVTMHTRYTQTGDDWNQSFRIDPTSINVPSNIFLLSPSLNYSKNEKDYSFEEVDELYAKLQKLESALLANDDYENLVNNEAFMKYWNTFENANLSDKKQVNLDIKSFYSDLVQYVKEKKAKEFDTKLSKLKTDKGREKATANYNSEVEELDSILKNNKKVLILLVEALNTAANIKMLLLPGLTKNKPDYKSFLRRKSTGEYMDSDGEGISISDAEGNIVKLVDRSTFSNANRDPDIESGFDHNESLEESYDGDWLKIKKACDDLVKSNIDALNDISYSSYMYTGGVSPWSESKGSDDIKIYIESSPTLSVEKKKQMEAFINKMVAAVNDVCDKANTLTKVLISKSPELCTIVIKLIKSDNDITHRNNKLAALKDLDLEEDLNGDIKITGVFEMLLGEALPFGEEDDFLDEDGVYEWFNFIDDIEDYIDSVGEVVSSSTSNVLNSLSSYIDFYKDGDDKKVLFDLRVSDHKETRNVHKTRIKNASSINKKYDLVSIVVNDKRFNSYDEALEYVKNLIGGTQKEMHERKHLNKLSLKEDSEFQLADLVDKSNKNDKNLVDLVRDFSDEDISMIAEYVTYFNSLEAQRMCKNILKYLDMYGNVLMLSLYNDLGNGKQYDNAFEEAMRSLTEDSVIKFNYLRKKFEKVPYNFRSHMYFASLHSEGMSEKCEVIFNKDKAFEILKKEKYQKNWKPGLQEDTNAEDNKLIVKNICKEVAKEFDYKVVVGLPLKNKHNIPMIANTFDDLFDNSSDTLIEKVVARLKEKLSKIDVPTRLEINNSTIHVYYADSDKTSGKYSALRDLDIEEDFTKNMINTITNTDKDPAVKATKEYHKMKIKKLKKGQMIVSSLCEDVDNTATVIWGRMNPITRGHLAMIKFAEEQEGDTFVFLSHSQDAAKNPLPYDRKIYWARLATGDVVKESNSKLVLQALKEVEEMGYNKLIYICGSDRAEEMTTLLNKYNGTPDKKGNIPFTFRSIEVKQFGNERLNEDIPLEKCSASFARKCVIENDFETFKQVVPFGDEDAEILFKELKVNMNINESIVSEALMTDKKIIPEASHDYYRMVLNDLAGDGVLMSDGEKYFIDDKKILKELDKLSSETDYKEKALRFYELTGLKWNKIEKSPYSGVSSSGKAKFSDIETTAFQEGITGLILADKLKVGSKSVTNYLLESDNEKKTGVFKYIKSTPDDKFKDKWLNLINLWGSRFEALYENRNSFINEANKHLDKDVKRCIIVHPALIGSPEDGNDLLIGADTYDKSDVYYCTNLKVLDILKSLRLDPAKYSEYMFKHQNEIIGVSLKKGGKDVVIKWDPSGVTFTGDVKIVKPQKENAVTFNIEFQSNEGPVILAVRSNQGESGGGTLEFKMKGGGAQIGKAVQAFKSYLTKYRQKEARIIMNGISSKGRDFELAAKTIVSLLTDTTKIELGETYKMTKQGTKLISTIFNLAGGFSAKNLEGKRITAPYIKVM